ncbi:hypothetical protein OAS81_05445 [Gammaproteobacteria bacterium]|nr:hypothetical protein [Gammaproteobacteria bacterium]
MIDTFEENRFSFKGIVGIFLLNRSFALFSAIIVAILSLNYAISLPNIYSAEAVLVPSKQADRGSGSSLGASGSNIAELVGLSGSSSSDRTSKSLKILESKDFFSNYYNDFYYLSRLYAVDSYDKSTNKIIFDREKIDVEKKQWIAGKKPTFEAAHTNFLGVLSIDYDRLDGFITLTMDHQSPEFAKTWLETIILDLNNLVKSIETVEAQNSSDYLVNQLSDNDVLQLNSIFSAMLIEAYETLMLSEISDQFALSYIDKPRVPQRKSKPSRAFVSIFLFIIGVSLISIFLFLLSALGKKMTLTLRPPRLQITDFSSN